MLPAAVFINKGISWRYLQDADRANYSIGLHNQTVGFVGAGCIAQATLKGMMNKGEFVNPSARLSVAALVLLVLYD